MSQPSIFDTPAPPERVELPDGDVVLHERFFTAADSARLFDALRGEVAWSQETIRIHGRWNPIPRLSAWFGDAPYTYSGITMDPLPWTPAMAEVKAAIEPAAGTVFNSALANLYRDGNDSVSWHSDDEPELGPEPVIASVSFGATRTFKLRHRRDASLRQDVVLTDGSLLVMRGDTQRCWHHAVTKSARVTDPRINLTFRVIV